MKTLFNALVGAVLVFFASGVIAQQSTASWPKSWNPADKTSALDQLNESFTSSMQSGASGLLPGKSASSVPLEFRCMNTNTVAALKGRYGDKLQSQYTYTKDLYHGDSQNLAFPTTSGAHAVGYQCFAKAVGPDGWHACIGQGNCNTAGYVFIYQIVEGEVPVVHVYNEGDPGKYGSVLWFFVVGAY